MADVGIIHTSPATVELFGRMLRDADSTLGIINVLDDSILPELNRNKGDLEAIQSRWNDYVRIVRERGVRLILNACSSIGALSTSVPEGPPITIVRVDSAMAREAIRRGSRIAVIATLPSTLGPTSELLVVSAREAGLAPKIERVLVAGAYDALIKGDPACHDDAVLASIRTAVDSNDVVVLAQASMARVAARLQADARDKVLSSPPFAVRDVVSQLATS